MTRKKQLSNQKKTAQVSVKKINQKVIVLALSTAFKADQV